MKPLLAISVLALGVAAGPASAGCEANTRVTGQAFQTLLGQGALICGRRFSGTPASDRWQEEHRGGGALWDYKKGPNDKVDPSKQVGTWSLNGNTVTHSYGGPTVTWTWKVHEVSGRPGEYSFCTDDRGNREIVRAYILTGSGPCNGYPP